MLKSRFPVARPLTVGLWLGSTAALGFLLSGFAGCQGPDTFLRKPGGGGGSNGSGGSSFGTGGHGTGGMFGAGGSTGSGGAGVGGRIGTGGTPGTGGSFGVGGARDGGADATGAGGSGMGGMFTVFDGSVDSEAGAAARGFCNAFCAPTSIVELFTVGPGSMGFHSPQTITSDEWCFSTTPGSLVSGANCSNFTGRTLTVNGVPQPNCGNNFNPPPVGGGWCFQISAGTPTFAAIAVF